MTDMERGRRETLRWALLAALNFARPLGASETVLRAAIGDETPGLTLMELRRELAYLADRRLVALESKHTPVWSAALTRDGVDLVEYTVPCEPGIARPEKYW